MDKLREGRKSMGQQTGNSVRFSSPGLWESLARFLGLFTKDFFPPAYLTLLFAICFLSPLVLNNSYSLK